MTRVALVTLALALLLSANVARADERVAFESAQYLVGGLQQRLARERGLRINHHLGQQITAYLARPAGDGPFPAVVILHGCGGLTSDLRTTAEKMTGRGYVSLAVDSFTPRGLATACLAAPNIDRAADAWGALAYLATLPFVDSKRIAMIGYAQGGNAALQVASLHDSELFELPPGLAYKAAAAFYPSCAAPDDEMTAPTLVLIGELDDWSSARQCGWWQERLRANSAPVKIVVYPDAHHSFDDPRFAGGIRYFGHWLQYNASAAERAAAELQNFLSAQLGQ